MRGGAGVLSRESRIPSALKQGQQRPRWESWGRTQLCLSAAFSLFEGACGLRKLVGSSTLSTLRRCRRSERSGLTAPLRTFGGVNETRTITFTL